MSISYTHPNRRTSHRASVQKVILATLMLLIVMLWVPNLTSPGDSGFNLSILVAIAIAIQMLFLHRFLSPKFATRGDAQALALLTAAMIVMIFLSVLSASYAETPFRVFRTAVAHFFGLVILYAVINLPSDRRILDRIVGILIWCAVISSAYATLANFYTPLKALAFGDGDRTSAFFKQANQFGIALSLVTPLAMANCVRNKRKFYPISQLIIIYLGLVFAGSKTNLAVSAIGAFCVIFVGLLASGALKRSPIIAVLIVLVSIGIGALGFATLSELNPRAHRLLLATASGESIKSLDDRKIIWRLSIEDGLEYPITGTGAGQYITRSSVRNVTHSHNIFLDSFRTLGIPGLALIATLIATCMHLAISSIHQAIAQKRHLTVENRVLLVSMGISVLTYLISNQFSDSFGPSTLPLFWVSLALLLYLRRMSALQRLAPSTTLADFV